MRCIVVGGGVKGLCAARRLLARGVDVTLLEADERLGGKIKTLRSSCGAARAELGAMRITDGQQAVRALLQELGLEVEPFVEDNDKCPFVVGPVRGNMRDMSVDTLVAAGIIEPDVLAASGLPASCRFGQALLAAFEDVGEEDQTRTVMGYLSAPCGHAASSKRSIAAAILDLRNGRGGMHTVLMVYEFVMILKLHSGDPIQISGGFDRVIHALAEDLPEGTVKLGCTVFRVAQSDDGVKVHCRSSGDCDGEEVLEASAVLLTNPGLQHLEFEPELPPEQRAGVTDLLNTNVAMKAVLSFRTRFWETPDCGSVVGGTSWVGPSDVNQVYFPHHDGVADCKGGFLMFYIRGPPMQRWKDLSETVRLERTLVALEALFPGADVRGLCEGMTEQWWDEEGTGAYYLTGARAVMDKLRPFGKIVFSPVPRGWIDDALTDGAAALDDLFGVLGLPAV